MINEKFYKERMDKSVAMAKQNLEILSAKEPVDLDKVLEELDAQCAKMISLDEYGEEFEEMSEGQTGNYEGYDVTCFECENKDVKITDKARGIVLHKVLNDDSEYVVDAQMDDDDLVGWGLQHFDNMIKADEYVKQHPEYVQDGSGTFYQTLKNCSQVIKDIYASMFIGVVDLYYHYKMGEYQEDGGAIVSINGDLASAIIFSLLVTKSCADCLPRVCRPNIANGVQHGDYGVDYDINTSRRSPNFIVFNTKDVEDMEHEINSLTKIESPYEGFDDIVWAEHDDVMIAKDSMCKIDIRKGFYNELMVDVELYTNTPANMMFRKIYEVLGSDKYKDMITLEYAYDNGDIDIDKFEVAKEALTAILNDTE